MLRLIWNLDLYDVSNATISLKPKDEDSVDFFPELPVGDYHFETLLEVGEYDLILYDGENVLFECNLPDELKLGANYQIILQYYDGEGEVMVHKITSENEIHICWLLPQFVIMTAGEIMFSITSLQFSFTQAPESMKVSF